METMNGRVFCRHWEGGSTLLIALHGFGESSNVFDRLDPSISKNKSLIAFDLPFHGKTEWNKPECSKEDIKQIIQVLLDEAQKSTCILLGFSLGGRIALSICPEMKEKVESLILLAPDGIHTKGLAWPEAIPLFFRRMIRRWILSSERSIGAIKWISSRHWFPVVSRRFANRHLSNSEKLGATLSWWTSLAAFPVSPSIIREMASTDPVPVQIWVGTRDSLISIRHILEFWQDYPTLEIVELKGGGHRVGFAVQ